MLSIKVNFDFYPQNSVSFSILTIVFLEFTFFFEGRANMFYFVFSYSIVQLFSIVRIEVNVGQHYRFSSYQMVAWWW